MDAKTLISDFGREAGVPLSLGESNTVAIAVEDGPVVELEYDPDMDVLHCYVVLDTITADTEKAATLYRSMLQANAFCSETDGATLGLDAGEIILSRRLELAWTNIELLTAVVQSLATIARNWPAVLGDQAIFAPPPSAVGFVDIDSSILRG